jgi:collagenase-like PrtC family protease
MKLTVPTNWENDLIKKIKKPYVDTVYGKLDSDFIGGGRASCVLLKQGRNYVKSYIADIHKEGFRFHYILNASCMGNREWTRKGQKEITALLDWLSETNVDGVIVTSPYILQLVKKRYSKFEISVSCFANVNSVEKAKFWQDLGASIITLSQTELNRNFKLLEEMRKKIDCDLQLIANDGCISDCPISFYHNNTSSHSSQIHSILGSFMFDYCSLMCRYRKIKQPVNFIRGTWIRPEDMSIYENIGFDRFKLADRTMDTEHLAVIINAYSKRSYKGNLYDLITSSSKSLWIKKAGLLHKLKYFFHPLSINLIKFVQNRKLLKYAGTACVKIAVIVKK